MFTLTAEHYYARALIKRARHDKIPVKDLARVMRLPCGTLRDSARSLVALESEEVTRALKFLEWEEGGFQDEAQALYLEHKRVLSLS